MVAVPAAPAPVAALVIAPSNALVLRQGTAVRFATDQALSSQKSKLGDRFELRTIDPVRVGELLVIPAGTRAVGEVTRAEKKGAFGKSGKLDTRILYVVLGDQHVSITGKSVDQGSSGTVGVVVAAALFWPAMPFITGKSAEVPAGTTLTGYIENDLPLVAAAAPTPAPVAPLVIPVQPAATTVATAPAAIAPVVQPAAAAAKATAIPTK